MKKLLILLSLGMLLFSSCEDLVEVNYPTNQIGTTQVFEDLQTANAALAGVYAQIRDRSLITGGSYVGSTSLLGSYTDELDCYYNDQNGVVDIYNIQQQETNTTIKSIWEASYKQIYYTNSIIYGAEKSLKLSETEKNRIMGEALFVRSLLYFYLQQIFGDIPYTTSLNYELNRHLSRTNSLKVLDQLAVDVADAASLMKDNYRDQERIYPNRKTAQLLLARIYLLRGEWIKAQQMADTILNCSQYHFQNDINEVFHKSGSHILWQLKPQRSGDPVTDASFYYFTNSQPSGFALTDDLINTFSDTDQRKLLWMYKVNFNGNTWYRPWKYKNLTGTNTNEYSVIFRLEEAYFIKAEALARQNLFDQALTFLNATRERAGLMPLVSISGEEFFNEELSEKRREFFCEFGQRFMDLKRLGRLNELSVIKTNWSDNMQVWPLPQSELLLNPNLLPQNAGY
jgi:starch-binding outer membrane protein, SusD/RagB family